MKRQLFRNGKVFTTLFIIIVVLASLFQSCEPGGAITFQNLQNREVTIFFATVRTDSSIDQLTKQGVISTNSTKVFHIVFPRSDWVNRIEAHDLAGQVVFSQDYKMSDLEKIDWKIVISP